MAVPFRLGRWLYIANLMSSADDTAHAGHPQADEAGLHEANEKGLGGTFKSGGNKAQNRLRCNNTRHAGRHRRHGRSLRGRRCKNTDDACARLAMPMLRSRFSATILGRGARRLIVARRLRSLFCLNKLLHAQATDTQRRGISLQRNGDDEQTGQHKTDKTLVHLPTLAPCVEPHSHLSLMQR